MAWDNYRIGELEVVSGDIPFDSLHAAIRRIRRHYLERFGRNPYLGELLYTLCRIAQDVSPTSFEDSAFPPIENLLAALTVPRPSDQIDPGNYEAGFDESCVLMVWEKAESSGSSHLNAPVLRLQVEDNRPEEVVCRYTMVSSGISDAAARCLIRLRVLRDLLKYDILSPDLFVRFEKA